MKKEKRRKGRVYLSRDFLHYVLKILNLEGQGWVWETGSSHHPCIKWDGKEWASCPEEVISLPILSPAFFQGKGTEREFLMDIYEHLWHLWTFMNHSRMDQEFPGQNRRAEEKEVGSGERKETHTGGAQTWVVARRTGPAEHSTFGWVGSVKTISLVTLLMKALELKENYWAPWEVAFAWVVAYTRTFSVLGWVKSWSVMGRLRHWLRGEVV